MIQYWMYAAPELVPPSSSKTNCSQPWQPAFGDPAQTAVPPKKFVLIWSVYALAIDGPAFAIGPLSLVTLTMFSKWPMAWEMCPDGACAEMSLLLPTTLG